MITTLFGSEVLTAGDTITFEGKFGSYCKRVDLSIDVPQAVHDLPALGQAVELRWSCPCGASGAASARKIEDGGYRLSSIDLLHAAAL